MGGLLLGKFGCIKYNKRDYEKVELEICGLLKNKLNTTIYPTQAVREKNIFGDMDLLVYKHTGLNDIKKVKKDISNLDGIVKESLHLNGNVLSLAYKPIWKPDDEKLQIDLIMVEPSNWEPSKIFFNYGELGNLMGKLFHKFGLKYGFDGLKYDLYIGKDKIGKFYVTKNLREAFSFLGISYGRYCQGFNNIEEVFDYITECPYFKKEIFYWSNLNAINKKRNKRRPNYEYFLEYIKDKDNKDLEISIDKTIYWDKIAKHFKDCNFYENITKTIKEHKIKKEYSIKWNGKWIIDEFKITGKKLGKVMHEFIKTKEDFKHWVLNTKEHLIKEDFRKFYNALENI